ncbi:unnamed protein product [Taenia asiatica]|uniref:Uncharacterized protein n=1 Tax=Taenia asiatica TaxID=60517 RepID=A0A0R3W6R3_TAEAS|nr:unnamed protein product [Taenia asiatica]
MIGYAYAFLVLSMAITATELIEKQSDGIAYKIIRNPDCDNATSCPKNETKLIQIIAKHPNKTIHFLLPGSNPNAPLSVVMLESDPKPRSIQFRKRIHQLLNTTYYDKFSFISLIGAQFCTYSDANDDARLTPHDIQSQCHHMLGKNLLWSLTDNAGGKNPLNFIYTAVNSTDSFDGLGKIVVNISFPRDKSELAQKGLFSLTPGNGLLFDITIDSVKVPKQGRVAVILLPFSQDPLQLNEDFTESTKLSENGRETLFNLHLGQRQILSEDRDPYMPEMAPRVSGHTPAFMQWTTTCEVSVDGVAKRRATANPRMQILPKMASRYRYSLPPAFYGDAFNQKRNPDQVNMSVGVRLQAVSFGNPHDGFYAATNFVRWRGILSMGEPVEPSDEGFGSVFAVGIALPLMLLVMVSVTAGIVMYRRHKARMSEGANEPLLPPEDNNISRSVIYLPHFRSRLCLFRRISSPQLSRCDEEPDLNV